MDEMELSPLVRPDRVVVGVTGSAGSAAALRRAVHEARRAGAELIPVLAWEPPGGEALYRRAPTPSLLAIWEQQARERLESAISAALGVLPPDVHVEPLAVRGSVVHALTTLARRPTDLIVLGAGPRHPLARLLCGGVLRHVVGRTNAPVLLVAPPRLPRSLRRELRDLTPEDFLSPAGQNC